MSNDDLKKPTPQATFKPVGTYRGAEPKGTLPVELPPSWAIALGEKIEGVSKSQGNLLDNFGTFGDRLTKVETELGLARGEVHELRTWKKSVGDSGMMPPFVRPDGPKPTPSGELRRVSENDLKQDAIISQILIKSAETATKVDALTTTQTEQTEKLVTLAATVGATDERKMVILEDVHKRATAFIDSPTGRLLKGIVYLAIATYAAARGVHIGN